MALLANRRAQGFSNLRSVILSESFPFACEWKAGVEGPAHSWRRRFPILGFEVRGTDRGPSTTTCDSQAKSHVSAQDDTPKRNESASGK